MLTAKDAKELSDQVKAMGLNFQRKRVLSAIQNAAENGNKMIVCDFDRIHLYPEDYQFFVDLGYKVKPPTRQMRDKQTYEYFAIISWD